MNMVNKIFTCCCCSCVACEVACCIDCWGSYEACGLAQLNCGHCCWKVCSPICHSCSVGSVGEGMPYCTKGIKYCLYACALDCVAPIDGIYNCVKYIGAVCSDGVTGFSDILKNKNWLNEKVKSAFELTSGNEP